MSNPLNIVGAIRDVSRKGREGERFAIQFKVTNDLFFDPTAKALVAEVTGAIQEQLRENLLAGKRPDGGSMPGISNETVKSRRSLEKTFKEGRQSKDQQRQYQASGKALKTKGPFVPKSGGPRGVVSGLLAESFSVRASRDGATLTVYVAGRRGSPDPGDNMSALQRVYEGVPLWTNAGMSQPKVGKALQKGAESLISYRINQIANNLRQALGNVQEIVESSSDETEE